MIKAIKKISGLFLAVVMMLTMSVSIFADTTNAKLTINGQDGAVYSAYQVLSAKNIGTDLYSYTVTNDFAGAFPITVDSSTKYVLNENNEICKEVTADGQKTTTKITGDTVAYDKTTYNTSSDVAKLAAALEDYAKDKTPTGTITISGTSGSADLPIGYYVVKQTTVPAASQTSGYIASKAILVNLTTETAISPKDDTEKLDKKITGLNDDTSQSLDENTAKIGDKINYKVTTYIPTYDANVKEDSVVFTLSDRFENIDYNGDVAVYIGDSEGDTSKSPVNVDEAYTLTSDTSSFTVALKPATILANQGKYVTLIYSGTLNKDALVNSADGNPNTVTLTYTNGPDNTQDSLTDTVKTYTFGVGVKKVDKATNEELDGAKFQLLDSNGNPITLVKEGNDYRVAKDDETGVTEFVVNSATEGNPAIKGLDAGTYTLRETQAPDSYSVVGDIKVTISAQKDSKGNYTGAATISVDSGKTQMDGQDATTSPQVTATDGTVNINVYVEDTKGISLPKTGSKAAMYCLYGGGLLVVLGGVFMVLSNRHKAK